MTRYSILTIIYLLSSCTRFDKQVDTINLNSNGDTLEVIRKYHSGNTKEIIYYLKNKPARNIGFYLNNDTLKLPNVIFTKQDNLMFVFIPSELNICSYDLIFATDSAIEADEIRYNTFHKLADTLHTTLRNLKTSITIKLDNDITNFGLSKGILKCRMDSGCNVFKYYPFDINKKLYD